MTERQKKAEELFREGFNCAQSALLAFEDLIDIDRDTLLKMSSSFGGGFGRMREVCGAVSGICMAAGLLFGYCEAKDYEAKKKHYALIQKLMGEFKEKNGYYVCRELLGTAESGGAPEARTPEYYKKRSCPELVVSAVGILEKEL